VKEFALILGGLGVYFFGSGGLRTTLQGLATRSFRMGIARWTQFPGMTAAGGFLLGLIIESSAVASVILGSIVARGAISARLAQRLCAWANTGLVVLVFITTLDIATVGHLIMGAGGIALSFNLFPRLRPLLSGAFHLALILLGLRLMKEGLTGLPAMAWFQAMAAQVGGLSITALALGILLRIPVQSSTAVAIIGAILYKAGIFNEFQALLMLAGTGLGTGFALYLLTSHLRGEPRQITLFQGLINAIAGGVAAMLLAVGHYGGWAAFPDLLASLADDYHLRFAFAFLFQQLLCVVAGWGVGRFAPGLMERLAPVTLDQRLSKPRFIYDEAVQDPEAALELAEKELVRLFQLSGSYLDGLREDMKEAAEVPFQVAHTAVATLGVEVQEYLAAIAVRRLEKKHSAQVLWLERLLGLCLAIEEGAFQLAGTLHGTRPSPQAAPVMGRFVEAGATMLLAAADAAGTKDVYDIDILRRLTENRGDFLEKLRTDYLREGHDWSHADRALLFQVTTQFEHVVVLLHRLAILLESGRTLFSQNNPTQETP
jgi:phosphate:Na+ symporter